MIKTIDLFTFLKQIQETDTRPFLGAYPGAGLPPIKQRTQQLAKPKKQQQSKERVGLEKLSLKDVQRQLNENQQIARQIKLEKERKIKQQADRLAEIKRRQEEARRKKIEQEKKKAQEQAEKLRLKKQKQEEQKQAKRLEKQKQDAQEAEKKKLQQAEQQKVKDEVAKEAKIKQQKEQQSQRKAVQLSRFKGASSQLLLDLIVDYAKSIEEGDPIKCAINSVGDIKKVTKDLIIWTDSFIEKIDINNPRQINTFCVKLWNVIVNQLIMKAKKDGIQVIPPNRFDAEVFKNCINTYILMVNLLRGKGLQKVWLFMVGKTLGLLDFIYKRKQILGDFKKLDLVQKGYIKKFGENFENVYFSRLDQLTYLLFGMLLMNPYDCFMDIQSRTNNSSSQVSRLIGNVPKTWDYSIFWLLIEQIRNAPFKYFKPVCYHNILSILNIQMVQARTTGNNKQFLDLYKIMVQQYRGFSAIQAKDPQIKFINNLSVDGYMDGQQFIDMLHPIKAIGSQKKKLVEGINIQQVQKKGSVLYYFKSQQP